MPGMHHPGFQEAALRSSGSSAHHRRWPVACAVDVRGARSDLLALRELQERRGSARLELAPKRGATFCLSPKRGQRFEQCEPIGKALGGV